MDQRQQEINVGKGLQESRLNQEFIDNLRKWGPYLVMAVSVVAIAYFGFLRWQQHVEADLDKAYLSFDESALARNPAGLVAVAEAHEDDGAVPAISRLAAADIHLEAYRTGVPIGVNVDQQGVLPADKALLTEAERTAELAKAQGLYQQVLDKTSGKKAKLVLAASALSGLASVAECKGELDQARQYYQQIETSTRGQFDGLADAAKARIESLDKLAVAKLYATAELPTPAEAPVVTPMSNTTGRTTSGQNVTIGADGQVQIVPSDGGTHGTLTPMPGPPPGFNPDGTPAQPVPAPAPTPAAPANP